MSKVQAQTKSVKELLSGVKYGIDECSRGNMIGGAPASPKIF